MNYYGATSLSHEDYAGSGINHYWSGSASRTAKSPKLSGTVWCFAAVCLNHSRLQYYYNVWSMAPDGFAGQDVCVASHHNRFVDIRALVTSLAFALLTRSLTNSNWLLIGVVHPSVPFVYQVKTKNCQENQERIEMKHSHDGAHLNSAGVFRGKNF